MGAVLAIWSVVVEVASFWKAVRLFCASSFILTGPRLTMDEPPLTPLQKILGWYTRKNPVELWLELLRQAEVFEDWEESALHLDNLLGLDHWYVVRGPLKRRRLTKPAQAE
jgi:TAG lipase/lysophosphatidylethanolamine acyltransferase